VKQALACEDPRASHGGRANGEPEIDRNLCLISLFDPPPPKIILIYLCTVPKPIISLIVAHGKNREIGAKNDLMWHLPDDFKWFIKHTKGKPMLMGRKTMESLPGPLKNRKNMVLSRANKLQEGFIKVNSLEEALAEAGDIEEIMIIGGGQIYEMCLPLADRLYITLVEAEFDEADVFFPEYNGWLNTYREFHAQDEKHAFGFEFQIWEK
jgi:dihydrofolate reductase